MYQDSAIQKKNEYNENQNHLHPLSMKRLYLERGVLQRKFLGILKLLRNNILSSHIHVRSHHEYEKMKHYFACFKNT